MDAVGSIMPLVGGVGLFLLGMWLMTEGLKLAAGTALERILATSTGTRLRGLGSGIAITALVQSSSAVTVATIGFINAGLLTLQQSLWVLFGANVGTTMTGWLVALAGVDIGIESASLPLIGLGMVLHLTGQGRRRGAAGMALAGFGTLFLGIDVLKDAFVDMGSSIGLPGTEGGAAAVAGHVLAGVALTVLMQSSSAALAVALTAAQGGVIPLDLAAAVVVGANVGTTVTAIIAAIGATPPARRAAAAHVVFNLGTGIVALVMLPLLLGAILWTREWAGADAAPAATLALFHTAFNLLGVAIMWPFADRLAEFLGGRFRSPTEDRARPRYLDDSVAAVPALALDAVEREVRRLGTMAIEVARVALGGDATTVAMAREQTVIEQLNREIGRFIARLNRASMAPESANRLPQLLRVARYYETVAELAAELATARPVRSVAWPVEVTSALAGIKAVLDRLDPAVPPGDDADRTARVAGLEAAYAAAKRRLLEAGALGEIPVVEMHQMLDRLSIARRGTEQALKAVRVLAAGSAQPVATPDAGTESDAPL